MLLRREQLWTISFSLCAVFLPLLRPVRALSPSPSQSSFNAVRRNCRYPPGRTGVVGVGGGVPGPSSRRRRSTFPKQRASLGSVPPGTRAYWRPDREVGNETSSGPSTTATTVVNATTAVASRNVDDFVERAFLDGYRKNNSNGTTTAAAVVVPPGRVSPSDDRSGGTATKSAAKSATPAAPVPRNSSRSSEAREVRIHRLPGVKRVHCISDLHVDHIDNWKWLEANTDPAAGEINASDGSGDGDGSSFSWDATDLIVVAGDISHRMDKLKAALRLLKTTGAHVAFVPGNHEAWLDDPAVASDSVTKLRHIEDLCRTLGVYTTGDCVHVNVGGGGVAGGGEGGWQGDDNEEEEEEELWILPLDSWYDGSLSFVDLNDDDPPPNDHLIRDFGKWPWVDFLRCDWPEFLYRRSNDDDDNDNTAITTTTKKCSGPSRSRLLKRIPSGLVEYFLDKNQPTIDAFHEAVRAATATGESESDRNHPTKKRQKKKKVSVLTVTHFLPNQQSLPDWKDLSDDTFRCESWLDHGAGGLSAKFALVGGSSSIDRQIRSLELVNDDDGNNSDGFLRRIHVFGHSHRPKDFVYRGIRYVHHPLGKPSERDMHMVDPSVGVKLLWEAGRNGGDGDSDSGGGKNNNNNDQQHHHHETILRYWEERGGGLEMLKRRMEENRRNRKRRSRKHHGAAATAATTPSPTPSPPKT